MSEVEVHVPQAVWNVHVLETSERAPHSAQLERLLNAHAAKGYNVHSIWSQSRKDRPFTRVVFVRHFSTTELRDDYLKEQARRRGSRIAPGRLQETTE